MPVRHRLIDQRRAAGIPGLETATGPSPRDPVAAVVDLALLGATGDGKSQFVIQAVRTLGARVADLDDDERPGSSAVMRGVLDAGDAAPPPTAPERIEHAVFRVEPRTIDGAVGALGRLGLYLRVGGLGARLSIALAFAISIGACIALARGAVDGAAFGGGGALLAAGWALSWIAARRRYLGSGEIEVAFWDVSGEHVLGDSAAAYYETLDQLTRARRWRATAWQPYAFAPVLVCNPLGLAPPRPPLPGRGEGEREEGTRFDRLRQLLPMFARLDGRSAMIAISRWSIVMLACRPDAARDQRIGVRAYPRGRDAGEPCWLTRDVVRRACLDAEDGRREGLEVTFLRYDAGVRCEVAATEDGDAPIYDYVYEHGPCAFDAASRRVLCRWLARLAYHEAKPGLGRAAPMPSSRPPGDEQWQPHGENAERTLEALSDAAAARPPRMEIVR